MDLRSQLRKALVRVLSEEGVARLSRWRATHGPSRLAFEWGRGSPRWLGRAELEALQRRYPPQADYGYAPDDLARRGSQRATALLAMLPDESRRFLELGCWDGMVSCRLQQEGRQATAVDARSEGFDARARDAGVELHAMDAAALRFPDASFDCVFSYDAFEHFADPAAVLSEAARVTRPGGSVYLEFGPLYGAALGLHAYRSITVPYCQFLFPPPLMQEFLAERGEDPIDFDHVNGWWLADYRRLFEAEAGRLELVRQREGLDARHLDLVRRHPDCFRGKAPGFEDLVVSSLELLFRRREAA